MEEILGKYYRVTVLLGYKQSLPLKIISALVFMLRRVVTCNK